MKELNQTQQQISITSSQAIEALPKQTPSKIHSTCETQSHNSIVKKTIMEEVSKYFQQQSHVIVQHLNNQVQQQHEHCLTNTVAIVTQHSYITANHHCSTCFQQCR